MSLRILFPLLLTACLLVGCGSDDPSESDRMADGHEGDTPTATEATRAPEIPIATKTVSYTQTPDGDALEGYLAAPERPDSVLSARGRTSSSAHLPGIVVIHEWWGLNDNIRAATRRLAGQGYRALAVDLYRGATARSPDSAQALMQQAMGRQDQLQANLQNAHNYLRSEAQAPRVAVLGWCFGGGRTFEAVAEAPTRYDAAVAYYGSPEPMTASVLNTLTTPVLAHFGRQDEVVSMDAVRDFQSRLENGDATAQVYLYDAGHAFANPSGESYDPEAAEQAWSRTAEFLQAHLFSEVGT